MRLKIGVLGGIGPEATGEFYLKLIRKLQEENMIRSNDDFPQIFINSIPAPELVFDKIKDSDLDMYYEGIKELNKFNPDFIVMVCNTIHLFISKLQVISKAQIIDLRMELRNYLFNENFNKVTIIGSPSTISNGLYEFSYFEYLNPDINEQKVLSDSIFYFNKGIDKEKQKNISSEIAKKYLSRGSEIIILGCTEFAVMLDSCDIPKINTIDLLVDSVIKRMKK